MHFVLICPVDESLIYGGKERVDRGETLAMLERLKAAGHTIEIIDSDNMTDSEQRRLYSAFENQAVMTGNAKNYRVRNVFGSNSRGGGYLFGKQVPALVVFPESHDGPLFPPEVRADFHRITQQPFACDLYPHKVRHGGEVSIRDFLQSKLSNA